MGETAIHLPRLAERLAAHRQEEGKGSGEVSSLSLAVLSESS